MFVKETASQTAAAALKASRQALILHLQIPALRTEDLLGAVNKHRKLLGLLEIARLSADTTLDAALSSAAKTNDFNKQSTLRDVAALTEAQKGFPGLAKVEVAAILHDLVLLEADSALLAALPG